MNAIYIYVFPLLLIWAGFAVLNRSRSQRSSKILQHSVESKLSSPASLHPIIDQARCLGCGACVNACPEGKILGLINGKAELVAPSECIGHGACKVACPFDAIRLVFGTSERGIDIPILSPSFETHRKGVFIAGELGGMGLVRNAITQGVQAVEGIVKDLQKGSSDAAAIKLDCDLLIVGAGPSGIAASLAALQHNIRAQAIEQDTLGGTVSHFPRHKLVMTAPVDIPLLGRVRFREIQKEKLLEFWKAAIVKHKPPINFGEKLEAIDGHDGCFRVRTNKREYLAAKVLLCLGRRGTPRKLGAPGEDLPKVVYKLVDAQQYSGQHILVVGGGDSALEAAISTAEVGNTTVSLSYRGDAFSRAKPKNRNRIDELMLQGKLTLYMQSSVTEVTERAVSLTTGGDSIELPNDAVIVCAGGILPMGFLKECGIHVETKFGTA